MIDQEHEKHMRRALELAEMGRGRTSPNPMVGAVIVKDGKSVAEGWHRRAGEPHAEIEALNRAGDTARGATIYINLEPCSHQGRTPPCAPALVQAGIALAVIGMIDPNPRVAGRGAHILRENNISVVTGILETECRKLNEAFIKAITQGLPFVTLKAAMTLDGKTAAAGGDSKWISSAASRAKVHRIRGEADAIIVGIETVLRDDPMLTSRVPDDEKIKDPLRVVFDSRLRTPADSNIARLAGDGKTVIITSSGADAKKAAALEKSGCRVIMVEPDSSGRPDPRTAMKELVGIGVLSVLLEGGGEINSSMVRAGLVDRVLMFMAPKLLGGRDAKTFLEGYGPSLISDSINMKNITVEYTDEDIIIQGEIDSDDQADAG